MKTFKQYITEGDDINERFLEKAEEVFTKPPYNFRWIENPHVYNISLIATRPMLCDNIVTTDDIAKILADRSRYYTELSVIAPSTMEFRLKMSQANNIDFENPICPLFSMSVFHYTEQSDLTDRDSLYVKMCFEVFEYYISLPDSKAIKTIKAFDYMNKHYPQYAAKEMDVVLPRAKIKYLPEDNITDDDHALNAMYNL